MIFLDTVAKLLGLRKVLQEAYRWLRRDTSSPPPVDRAPVPKLLPRGLTPYEKDQHAEFTRIAAPQHLKKLEECSAAISSGAFAIGVLFGPSGVGKSSLVAAGLMPALPRELETIRIQATAAGTEEDLLQALRDRYSALSQFTLKAAMTDVARRPSPARMLIVLDQFEQWVWSHKDQGARDTSELLGALVECNATNLQCLLVLRKEAVGDLLEILERPPLNLRSSACLHWVLEAFDEKHARHVLHAFAEALSVPYDDRLKSFVDEVVSMLASGGGILPVQLALLLQWS